MTATIFKANDLSKKYGDSYALKNVSLQLYHGQIYGFIGENGAGKTTLMRIMAGLSFPTSGNIELFGCSHGAAIRQAREKIGFMIEAPSINLSMTAKENLHLNGIMKGITNSKMEDDLLHIVGLQDAKKKKTRNFSLGMKQRLGIAMALIGNPELLVLDEPINGLDPVGIVEIRDLLVHLCKDRNISILLSSHNLPELYQVATHYIIIDHGIIKKETTLSELEEQCKKYVLLRSPQSDKMIGFLQNSIYKSKISVMPDGSVHLYDCLDHIEEIAVVFQHQGIITTNLSIEGDTLENYYLRLIGGKR